MKATLAIASLVAVAIMATSHAEPHAPKQGYAITKHYANPHDPMVIGRLLKSLDN